MVEKIVSELQAPGVSAEGEIREIRLGHVAAAIVHAAQDHDARLVVLGSSSRTDLPRIPLGSVAPGADDRLQPGHGQPRHLHRTQQGHGIRLPGRTRPDRRSRRDAPAT